MSIQDDLAEVKRRLDSNLEVTEEQILDRMQSAEQAAADYQESPEQTTELLETLKIYRIRLGAADTITNARLVQLIAENDFLLDQPTREDKRSVAEIARGWGFWADKHLLSWQDSRTGKIVAALILTAIVGLAIYPGIQERRDAYNQGYRACKLKSDAGVRCP